MKESARRTIIQDIQEDLDITNRLDTSRMAKGMASMCISERLGSCIPESILKKLQPRMSSTGKMMFEKLVSTMERFDEIPCISQAEKDVLLSMIKDEVVYHMIPDLARNPYSLGIKPNMAQDLAEAFKEIENKMVC